MQFCYDDGMIFLSWLIGEVVDNVIWILVFLVLVVIVNFFLVKVFGEFEYVFGSIKFIFIVMFIVLMFILDNM